jgi:hypothetical protein
VLREEGVQLNSGSAQKLFREQIVWADQELSKGHTLRSVAEALGVSGTLIRLRRKQLLAQTVGEIFSVRENELSEIPNNQKSVRGRG